VAEPRLEVDLIDETGLAAAEQLELLGQVARRTLQRERPGGDYRVTVTVVPDRRIRTLNRAHRGVDRITDVLSFPLEGPGEVEFVRPPSEPADLGDVVLALERARRQAGRFGHSFERELAYLTVHGLLHLLGYDHEEETERALMRAREEEILSDLPR